MNCPNCNSVLEDGSVFCTNCGTRVPEASAAAPAAVFCTNCGTKTSAGSAFCENCGARLDGDAAAAPVAPVAAAAAAPEAAAVAAPKAAKPTFQLSSIPKKWWTIGGIALGALVLLIVAIVIIVSIVNTNARKNYAVYMKDHELMFYGIGKDTKTKLTEDLADGMDKDYLAQRGSSLAPYTVMTNKNQRLFFLDEIDNNEGEATLKYLDVYEKGAKPKEVDTIDLEQFAVSEDGTKVIFEKGGDLYEHNLKERTKIASDVGGWFASKDCKRVIFMNEDNDVYEKVSGKDKEKVDSGVSSIYYISDDGKTIVYKRDENLYVKKSGKDKEKIASEIYNVVEIYSATSIYYTIENSKEIKISDYLDDDMKDSDAAMVKPTYPTRSDPATWSDVYTAWPDYPYSWNYETTQEYEAAYEQYNTTYNAMVEAYNKAVDKYYEDYNAYDAKQDRDYIRENASDYDFTASGYALYYYDGKDSTLLTESYSSEYGSADETAVLVYTASTAGEAAKVKISEVESLYSLSNQVKAALEGSIDVYVATGKTATALEAVEGLNNGSITLDPAGKTIYAMANVEENEGELYRATISKNSVGKLEKVDEDVYYRYYDFVADGKFVYFKDYKSDDYRGELYMDAKLVDSDVYVYGVYANESDGSLLYFVDWNREKQYGTLKTYKSGSAKKIADDVHAFGYTSKGELLYLYDYSMSSYSGELFLYADGKSKKVDTDVNAILSMYNK